MSRLFTAALAAICLLSLAAPRPARAQSGRPDSAAHAGMAGMPGMSARSNDTMAAMSQPLDIPHSRMGSGTSWIPDASGTREYQRMAGSWMLMAHGVVDLYYDGQGSARGDTQVGSANWLMGMAMRPLGGGTLQLDAMLSAEPLTVGGRGYPLLLQTGESYQGQPLHDRQHPHDLFMELAAIYEHQLSDGLAISLYAAPVGEPALGPVAFMHRPSAQSDLFAPISHHWQDATHITFGVATAGIYSRTAKLEGSVFNGREPDENRYDFDFRSFDSWSARVALNPAPEWSLNASFGFLKCPEGLHPDESQHRAGISIMRTAKLGAAGEWAAALIYGGNRPAVAGVPRPWQHSVALENNAQLDGRNTVFGRMTWVQKTAEELVVPGLPADQRFNITTVSIGYTRELTHFSRTAFSLGIRGEVGFIPAMLEPIYGTRNPAGIAVFARLRPMASAEHGMGSSMPMGMSEASSPDARRSE